MRTSVDPYRLVEPRAVMGIHFSERAFSCAAPRLFHRLPPSLKTLDSIESFKSKIKMHLFERAYDTSYQMANVGYTIWLSVSLCANIDVDKSYEGGPVNFS